ncbi:MAG: hydrogenase expression/formation protein HypD, partial [Leptospirillum sp. Group IV 'UBA BS']
MSALPYIDSFRDPVLGRSLLADLLRQAKELPRTPVRIMEFCGATPTLSTDSHS